MRETYAWEKLKKACLEHKEAVDYYLKVREELCKPN